MPARSDTALVPVPIRPGMREDIHRHAAAEPGTLRYAQNVRWGTLGAAERRNGTVEVSSTVGLGSQFALTDTYPVELAKSAGGGSFVGKDGVAFALRPSDSGWRFAGRYSSAEPRASRVDLQRSAGQFSIGTYETAAIDTAGNRLFAYAVNDFSDNVVVYTLQDSAGNTIESETFTNAYRCRAVSAGTDIFLVIQRYASNEVDIYRSQSGGTVTLLTSAFVTLDSIVDPWDIAPWTSSRWLFASLDTSSTTITVHRMSAGASVANVTQSTNVRASSRISIHGSPNHAWLGWSDNTVTNGARISCYDASLSAVFTSTTALLWTATTQKGTPPIIGTGPSDTEVRVCLCIHNESSHATPDAYTWKSLIINTSGTITKQTTQYHAIPVSKPFGPSGQYIWADLVHRDTPASPTEAQKTRALLRCRDYTASADMYWVVDLVGHRQTENAAIFQTSFDGAQDWWHTVPFTPEGTYFAPIRVEIIGSSANTGSNSVTSRASFREFAINSTLGHRDTADALGSLNVAGQPCAVIRSANVHDLGGGGAAMNTDGYELGFHRAPVIRSLTASNSTGSLTSSGTYSYVAVYKITDSAGRVHRSAPSAPVSVTLGASDDTVAVAVATCEMQRFFLSYPSFIEVYRTEADQSTYYLLDDAIENDAGAIESAFTDELADASLSDNRILYTQTSVANDMAPACRFIRASETRLWLAGLWDARQIQASQLFVPGEPPLFSDLDTFKVLIPTDVTGLAFQDGALLAFAATDIYAVGTDGGPDNGGVGTFQDPRLISPGIGCEEPASIVETPNGVFFRSRRGFELLPRGLGAPQSLPGVETTLETYTTVVSSCLHVDETAMSVHVVVRNPSNAATRNLVYDLDRGAWSVDIYPVDVAQVGVTADGRLLLASDDTSTSPAFLVESSSAQDDDSVFYQAKLTFHDIYPVGVYKVCNVNSVFIRGDSQGSCVLNADIGVDGGTAKTATSTFLGATTFEAYRHTTPANSGSHGTSVQISVYDTSSGDAAEGFNVYGLGIVVQDRDQPILTTSAERMA